MCEYTESRNVMPGWGCCRCRTYNGLQRPECRTCGVTRHVIEIPDTVPQCSSCGFGMERVDQFEHCPVCNQKLGENKCQNQ